MTNWIRFLACGFCAIAADAEQPSHFSPLKQIRNGNVQQLKLAWTYRTGEPLAVFVRGGESYRRIEPDFVVLKDGVLMVVEVDGDTVHEETPAEAHARTTMLLHEGALVERVKASECDTTREGKGLRKQTC